MRIRTSKKERAAAVGICGQAGCQRAAILQYLFDNGSGTGKDFLKLGILCYTKRIAEINANAEIIGFCIGKNWLDVKTRYGNGHTKVAEYYAVPVAKAAKSGRKCLKKRTKFAQYSHNHNEKGNARKRVS